MKKIIIILAAIILMANLQGQNVFKFNGDSCNLTAIKVKFNEAFADSFVKYALDSKAMFTLVKSQFPTDANNFIAGNYNEVDYNVLMFLDLAFFQKFPDVSPVKLNTVLSMQVKNLFLDLDDLIGQQVNGYSPAYGMQSGTLYAISGDRALIDEGTGNRYYSVSKYTIIKKIE